MPTSATGCCDRVLTGRSGGFTLLELLVALVIVAVGLSLAVISLRPDPRGVVRQEADRLAALLGLASEEAVTGGRPLAWVSRAGGYEFQAREIGDQGPEWTLLRGDDLLHPRELPSGIQLVDIQVDGQPQSLGQRVTVDSAHELSLALVLGEARAQVIGKEGHFRSELETEAGSRGK